MKRQVHTVQQQLSPWKHTASSSSSTTWQLLKLQVYLQVKIKYNGVISINVTFRYTQGTQTLNVSGWWTSFCFQIDVLCLCLSQSQIPLFSEDSINGTFLLLFFSILNDSLKCIKYMVKRMDNADFPNSWFWQSQTRYYPARQARKHSFFLNHTIQSHLQSLC